MKGLWYTAINQTVVTVTCLLYHPAEYKHKYLKKNKKTLGKSYSTTQLFTYDKFLSHSGRHPSLSSHLEVWAHQLVLP